jgi:RNA polymerase sigma-70 factor (ECF subfamily)
MEESDRIRMNAAASIQVGESMLEVPTIGVQSPDELLVRRAREGDRAACEELFQRHRSDSYRLAYRYLGHEQDALDVVQEAMIKAFSALGDFDGRSGFRTWLLKIVRNTSLDWGRRRKRRPGFQAGIGENGAAHAHELAAEDDPARRIHQQDLRRILDQAMARLSHTIRETFILFAELGMSYKEIAEVQDVPIGTVMSRIHSARGKLQADLDWDRLNGLL